MAKKSIVGGDKRRNAFIVGGFFFFIFFCIAVAWFVSLASKSEQAPEVSRINKASNKEKVTTAQNQAYIKQLDGYNTQKGSTAYQNGNSWISIPAYYSEEVKPKTTENTQTQYRIKAETTSQQNRQSGMKPANIARQEAQAILDAAEASWRYATPVDSDAKEVTQYASVFMPAVTTNTTLNAAAPTAAPAVIPFKLYDALKLCPAKLLTQLDTDTNSIVRATLMCAELSGATLLASGYKLVGEDIDMTFSLMSYQGKNERIAKTYRIQAKPIDLDTGRSMLSGNVNNRYFSRIFIPAIALGVAKTGQLYEKTTAQDSYVSNGTVVTSSDGKVSTDQIKGTFFGGLAQQTADVLKADNARTPPIQVERPDKPTFGVIFIEPVMSSDAIEKTDNNAVQQASYSQPASQKQIDEQRSFTPGQNNGGPIFNSVSPE
ncbi:DotG/IcmE/VirB10 family protein [Salmonella enterica]|nr:DotG/IcmE/VirB10 family protein [Salmonella enterica]